MAFIKEESEDVKIEETFTVKQEDLQEQTERMKKPKQKPCHNCGALNVSNCKTCRNCFAAIALKASIMAKQKNIEESSWAANNKKHRNAARVVDSARTAVKKLEMLGYKPLLFISKEKKKGFNTELITTMGPFGEGPQQKIIDKMASLYEVFIKNFQRFQNSAATDPDVCQNLASSVSPPASIPPSSSSSLPPPPSFPNLSPPQTSSSFPPSFAVPPPSLPNLSPPQSSFSFPPSSDVSPPSFPNLPPPQSSSSFPPSSATPPLSSNLIPPTNSSSFSSPTSSYITPLPPASSYKTLPAPPPTSLTTTPTSSLSSPAVQCMTTDFGDSDLFSRESIIKGDKQKKWIYKEAECQVHFNQKTFPYDRIVKRRMSKEGVEEAKVRWKPCSGCGMKWKDSWEPLNHFL
ncbi:uncharacterized protein LOC100141499 [Danio rerio]|uniref:Uncharacterized protein LOC100141499 n=1 Tax=Danio rerio TaxID=7955 RepID=A8WGL9_DANRE|nr:uncharacterized protein LOC100141499 [Danio rerio]AAI54766.1 Zgc:174698 protein [Danio rerio]|eukprot:NP_001108584.1 uncharacterized protein LOC100141499 [Danio rerio]